MKSSNLKQSLRGSVLFHPVRGKIRILGGWWRQKPRNGMSCSQEGVGGGTDGLLTWIVKPFIGDTQPKTGHLRQKKRLQIYQGCGILLQ